MEKLDIVWRIVEILAAATGASLLTRFLTIRARVRQENADAQKAEQGAKSDQIENIEKMVEKAYKPIIEDLTRRVQELQDKVDKMDKERDALNERIDELEAENRRLRSALRELSPDSIPSRRGENGKSAPRKPDGKFARKEETGDAD